ncbi:MAG: hypothetical protein F6K28_36130 [Microcoleus sp. SIO2G3]|nr:hypothetical protein [Microcoleus sp. SIO2G3]
MSAFSPVLPVQPVADSVQILSFWRTMCTRWTGKAIARVVREISRTKSVNYNE